MLEPSPSLLTSLYNLDGYRRYFTDAEYWQPFVSLICARHSLEIIGTPRSGLPGTFPTFIVSDRWVIKYFGPLFSGLSCFQVEQAASSLLAEKDFPVPAILTTGNLFPVGESEFPWPYLIYEYIPGRSIGEVYNQVSYAAKAALARQLGSLLKQIHSLPLQQGSVISPDWQFYLNHLTHLSSECQQRHNAWGSLVKPILDEIPRYLFPPSVLLPPQSSASLIHADLTRDHLLGDFDGVDWHLHAMIDFGDALSGDLFYELVVLHLEIFDADPHLLGKFLNAYKPSAFHLKNFTRKAMTLTLLHPYNAFATLFARHPELRQCASLNELAHRLWNVDSISIPS